jgi:hypothetical protein
MSHKRARTDDGGDIGERPYKFQFQLTDPFEIDEKADETNRTLDDLPDAPSITQPVAVPSIPHAGVEKALQAFKTANPMPQVYQDFVTQKQNDAVTALSTVARGMGGIQPLSQFDLHVKAIPYYKAYGRASALLDPKIHAQLQDQFSNEWKKTSFVFSRGLQEGKRKYPIAWIEAHPKLADELSRWDKDFAKAIIMHVGVPRNWLRADEKKHRYISSKNFHKVFMGRVQKNKKAKLSDNLVTGVEQK